MSTRNPQQDLGMLELLRQKAERLTRLEQRITELDQELKQEQSALLDVTSHLAQELETYREIKEEWEWFFENSIDMLCVAGVDGYFKKVNRAFTETLGYPREELLAHPFIDFVHPDDVQRTMKELHRLGAGFTCVNFENRYRARDGSWHWLAWTCPPLLPSTSRLYAIARDVTESKRSSEEVLYRAMHDALTGLSNRAAFEHELAQSLARITRNPGSAIALLLIDLDGFKAVNDTYGHAAGDELLKEVSRRFMAEQRQGDLVCRLGGDEFAWLAEGRQPLNVGALAERLLHAVNTPISLTPEASVRVGCSIGIALAPDDACDGVRLLECADHAMYGVKKTGKNGYARF